MRPTGPGPLSGQTLDGRYRLGDRIARGGMGTVYRAEDLRLQRPVAVKILDEPAPETPEGRERISRFAQEARAAAGIIDPHVVTVTDQGLDGSGGMATAFLVMELVDGATLRDLIRRRAPMTLGEALSVMLPMLRGLSAAHRQGLVHRDVKPENVLVSPEGSVKITDFGLTRQVQAESATLTLMGSAHYIAPELVRRQRAGTSADLYSAGVILYEMLTGVPPFRGGSAYEVSMAHVDDPMPDLRRRWPEADPEIAEIIQWCCAKDPGERPQRADDLLSELEHLAASVGEEALKARPPGYREDEEPFFAVLRPDSHTEVLPRAAQHPTPPPPGSAPEPRFPGTSDATAVISASAAPSYQAAQSFQAAHSYQAAPSHHTAQSSHIAQVQNSARPTPEQAHADPQEPMIQLGGEAPYRGWVWLLVFLLLACTAGYLGWLLGVQVIGGQSIDPAAAPALTGAQAAPGLAPPTA